MSDDLFRKIVKDGKEMNRPFFVPFLNGEPFVFPRIWEWLDYLKAEDCRVHIYTNAELVDVDRLVKYTNISCICCGINAATKETYNKVVRGPDYSRVVANVKELTQKAQCKVFASMVVVDENQHEKALFRKTWGRNTIFGEFRNWGGDKHCQIERTGERISCYAAGATISVLWDGRVAACCMDYDGKLILGDVNNQTLTEIFHQAQWFRRKHRSLDFDMIPCRDCNLNII